MNHSSIRIFLLLFLMSLWMGSQAYAIAPQTTLTKEERIHYLESARIYWNSLSPTKQQEIPIFTDFVSAVRWLQVHRGEFSSLRTRPGEEHIELSLSYLMQVLWSGDKLYDILGQTLSARKFQAWGWWASAADYFESSEILKTVDPFIDPITPIRWLHEHRAILPALKIKTGEYPNELTINYLMKALWIGDKLHAADGQPLPARKFQTWSWWASAADYAMKREALIKEAFRQLWHQLDSAGRASIVGRPELLNLQLTVPLTSIRDERIAKKQPGVISDKYRKLVLLMAWELYGQSLWASFVPKPDDTAQTTKFDAAVDFAL